MGRGLVMRRVRRVLAGVVASLLGVVAVVSVGPAAAADPAQAATFVDVAASDQFFDEITWLASTGVSTGWDEPDGTKTFRPGQPVARDAMAAFLYRFAGSPDVSLPAVSPFADVTTQTQFYKEICWLAAQGVSTGWDEPDGTKTFRPLQSVNRDAMAAFMYRFAGKPGHTVPATSPFADVAPASQFFSEITWLAAQQISTGWAEADGSRTFRPVQSVNRDAMAAFLFRLHRVLSPTYPIRVSVAPGGTQADAGSHESAISADGRWVAYRSGASNLVPGDTNATFDIFLWDRDTRSTTRVSVATAGTQANNGSSDPSISGDGRWVTYRSGASNLVAGDTNDTSDVFLWDRDTGATSRISVATDGTQADGWSDAPAISGDGRWIVFRSAASNLVADDTNGTSDVFLWDRDTGTTSRVSVATDGTQADGWSDLPAISADGRWVSYRSGASNLVADDTNAADDVFLWGRDGGTTSRVSVASDGSQANGRSDAPAISGDGSWIAYQSYASNLVPGDSNAASDVFLWGREGGTTSRVWVASDGSQANGPSDSPAISGDGRWVSYRSTASNLVVGDTNAKADVFAWDRAAGTTRRVSLATDGAQPADGFSYDPAISSDGVWITYWSYASNLVAGDTNGTWDVFVTRNQLG